jgi:hypothetical protein
MREKKIGKRKSQTRTWANSTLIGPPPRTSRQPIFLRERTPTGGPGSQPPRVRAWSRSSAQLGGPSGQWLLHVFRLRVGPDNQVPVPDNFVSRMAAGRCALSRVRGWLRTIYPPPIWDTAAEASPFYTFLLPTLVTREKLLESTGAAIAWERMGEHRGQWCCTVTAAEVAHRRSSLARAEHVRGDGGLRQWWLKDELLTDDRFPPQTASFRGQVYSRVLSR